MKILVLVLALCMVCSVVFADQKYNALEDRWETVPDNWEVKYNTFEDNWSYQPKTADVEYNAFEDSWDWDSGHNPDSDYFED